MTEPQQPPEPLPDAIQAMLAGYREDEALAAAPRERIWKAVSAPQPPARVFVRTREQVVVPARRRWLVGVAVAAAAVAMGWFVGIEPQRADSAADADRHDAAAMSQRGQGSTETASTRDSKRTGARGPSDDEAVHAQPDPAQVDPEPSSDVDPTVVDAAATAAAGDAADSTSPKGLGGTRRKGKTRSSKPARALSSDSSPELDSGAESAGLDPARAPDPTPSSLAEEQRLISGAWAALTSGDAAGALKTARAHRARFSDGVLLPERDAVIAIARCTLTPDDAPTILAGFAARHWRSPLATRVAAACQRPATKTPTP